LKRGTHPTLLYPCPMRVLPGSAARGTAEPPPKRSESSAEQRQRLLRATAELVAKRGYTAVTLELIAERCDVSLKTFYRQFSSKEECFIEFFDQATDEARRRAAAALGASPTAPWPEQVVIVIRELFSMILADPILARACIVEAPSVGRGIDLKYRQAMKALLPLIRQGRAFLSDQQTLPDSFENTIVGGVLWSAHERLLGGETDQIENLLPEAILFVLRPYLGESEASKWANWSQNPQAAPGSSIP
jgi:AcrR family transcriptional regulator